MIRDNASAFAGDFCFCLARERFRLELRASHAQAVVLFSDFQIGLQLCDLRGLMRRHPGNDEPLLAAIRAALLRKPLRHEFAVGDVQILRFMNATGG